MERPDRLGREGEALTAAALLLAATLEIVADQAPRVHVETDGSPPALFAADLVRRHVVLMTGTALPDRGDGAALRFERSDRPGYRIVVGDDAVVSGADLARAAYDILEAWGCRFGGDAPVIPKQAALSLAPGAWNPARRLLVEAEEFDPSLPADGIVVAGVGRHRPDAVRLVRDLGYEVRVVSTTFDDFLPPVLFAERPEWFALRHGERAARGNFALKNADARNAYLENLGVWLGEHPEVDCVGIWPEVTSVWDEEAAKAPAESYALLWREAAERFPDRRFEILATGLTLRPPAGRVPDNVDVRLRPGRDASALQGIAGQEIEGVVKAWEVRGARLWLEIDAAPAPWCGMPWPCDDAIRENTRRFDAAVLRNGGAWHARLWRDPAKKSPAHMRKLLERAAHVDSWGHPRDAADLFFEEEFGLAFRLAATERLYRIAADPEKRFDERRTAAADAYLGFRAIERQLPPAAAEQYRRFRTRDYRRLLEELLPGGVEHQVGPARVADGFDSVTVETDRLQLVIGRRRATVDSVRRRIGKGWSADLAGGRGNFFTVVALREKSDRTDGEVEITSPATGRVRIELKGRLHRGGPRWSSVLEYSNASGLIRQTATVDAAGGIAAGCRWQGEVFDRWVCPPHAAEGRFDDAKPRSFRLPRGTLLYCRDGERGPGLAARAPDGAVVSILRDEGSSLVATHPARRTLRVDWIVFTDTGELGK